MDNPANPSREELFMDQPQKSLRLPKIPDFFAAKVPKIMDLRLFITAWDRWLLV